MPNEDKDMLGSISINDADFYLRRSRGAEVPKSARRLLTHEMHLQGICVTYDVWFVRGRTGGAVWQAVTSGGAEVVTGRLFRTDADPGSREGIQQLAEVLVRARWPFEVAGDILEPGLISADLWNAELVALANEHETHAQAALEGEVEAPSAIIATARSLGLGPEPQGEASHQGTARCPRGSSHPIFISTSSDEWGCPWCRRKGGPEELLAFAAEHNVLPRPPAPEPVTTPGATGTEATIDWDFHPASYFGPRPLVDYLISKVSNAVLREELEAFRAEGREEDVRLLLGQEGISRADTKSLETLHPILLGGNYLPELQPGEVEVARVVLASTTFDVACVYSRMVEGVINYRVVDEYEGDTLQVPSTVTSTAPLSLDDLVTFFIQAWPLPDIARMNFEGDLEGALGFFSASSSYYPKFAEGIRRRVTEWWREREASTERASAEP